MAMHLYLLRHGKTLFNEKNITQGWCDSLLMPDAIKATEALSQEVIQLSLDVVYSSPMLRAKQTAFLATQGKWPIKEDHHFMEINYGYLEGDSAKNLQFFYPDRYDFKNFKGYAGGENWQQAGGRFMKGIQRLIEKHDGQSVLLVSHGAVITYFLNTIDSTITSKVPNLHLVHCLYDDGTWSIVK